MRKSILPAISLLLLWNPLSGHAGGHLTNTNTSIAFNRNFARNATLELDGAYSNPAGLAWLGDGWHLALNLQSVYQKRNIDASFAPFSLNTNQPANANGVHPFEGSAAAPAVPSVQAAYQKGNWTVSANFAITGGGGKCSFNEGLPSFESQVAMIPAMLTQAGISSNAYSLNTYMYGRQYVYGLQGGLTWRAFNRPNGQGLSVYLGARMNYVTNKYTGYLKNISAGINNQMVELNPFFSAAAGEAAALAAQYSTAASQAKAEGNDALAQQYEAAALTAKTKAGTYETYATATADKELNCTQSGWGLTPIIGIDYKLGALNLGARCEFNTHLNIENDTRINTTGVTAYDNGVNTPNDLPGMLSLGAQYDLLSVCCIMAGYHYFFDKNAGMANNKQDYLKHNTHEWLFGVEVPVSKRLLLSCGGQITNYGSSDAYQSDMSFSCDSYSLGFGARISVSPKVDIDVAYFWTTYSDYTKESSNYNGTQLPGTDTYSRTNKVFGAGVTFRL